VVVPDQRKKFYEHLSLQCAIAQKRALVRTTTHVGHHSVEIVFLCQGGGVRETPQTCWPWKIIKVSAAVSSSSVLLLLLLLHRGDGFVGTT
jgi:hypothetical protein